MRTLLIDLCAELSDTRSSPTASPAACSLPAGYFRLLADALAREDFDHWKVVGWIEGLNDLVYFQDVQRQMAQEPDLPGFAEQLLVECEEKFYENSYLDDVFPSRRPDPHRLAGRLARLIERLAREITQESLFLVPGLPCRWLEGVGRNVWTVDGTLAANLERAELGRTIPVGLAGAYLRAPRVMRAGRGHPTTSVRFVISPRDLRLRSDGGDSRIGSMKGTIEWDWPFAAPQYIVEPGPDWPRGLTLGPTLVYDRHRVASTVCPSSVEIVDRVRRAVGAIVEAWPQGAGLLALFTSRLVPLRAEGVVSFSYRHRPGLSFVNTFDRGALDLIDDLIHENSHHHLNLLLRKFVLHKGDHNQEIFYSPWRRSLRPLRGILHATFTFTMGALLFERLAQLGGGRSGSRAWRNAGLTPRDFRRAQFRCLEEIASVRYSLRDLHHAAGKLGWVPKAGRRLIRALDQEMARMASRARGFGRSIAGTTFARELARHERQLQAARETYGPERSVGR